MVHLNLAECTLNHIRFISMTHLRHMEWQERFLFGYGLFLVTTMADYYLNSTFIPSLRPEVIYTPNSHSYYDLLSSLLI